MSLMNFLKTLDPVVVFYIVSMFAALSFWWYIERHKDDPHPMDQQKPR